MTKLLKPLASLKLTVTLLALSMFLVYAGTWAQVGTSNWDVQKQFFYSNLVWIPIKSLWTRVHSAPGPIGGFKIPFPGGYVLGLLLLINLLAAHAVRFKLTWKRTGVILIHLGLILLLVGEGVSSAMKIENNMDIDQGSYANYTWSPRDVELAVIDRSPADHDRVTVVSAARLAQGGTITDPNLPFAIKVDAFYPNVDIVAAKGVSSGPRATTGVAERIGVELRPRDKFAGTGENAMNTDLPGVYFTPVAGDKPLGTFLSSVYPLREDFEQINEPQPVSVNGKTYDVVLRWKRTYKPYTLYLNKFSFDRYPGTEIARNYSSDVRLVDAANHEDRTVRIWMNHPLRYDHAGKGYTEETFFQADFNHETERGTRLQVVQNPAWTLPYIACAIGGFGLVLHFGMMLVAFARRRFALIESTAGFTVAPAVAAAAARAKSANALVLQPAPRSGFDLLVPAAIACIFVVYLIGRAIPHDPSSGFNVRQFGQIPVAENGRIQPLDSVARVALRTLRGKESALEADGDEDHKVKPAQWLLDVMYDPAKAADYKSFRVDYPELVNRLTVDLPEEKRDKQKFFSLNQILAKWPEFAPQVLAATTAKNQGKTLTVYQDKLMDVMGELRTYLRLSGPQNANGMPVVRVDNPSLREALALPQGKFTFSPREIEGTGHLDDLKQVASAAGFEEQPDPSAPPEARAARDLIIQFAVYDMLCPDDLKPTDRRRPAFMSLRLVPPSVKDGKWVTLNESLQNLEQAGGTTADRDTLLSFARLHQAHAKGDALTFNTTVASYLKAVGENPAVSRGAAMARFEAWFNAFDPFMSCIVMYLTAFVFVCLSWLGWTRPLYRTAATIIILSLAVHTVGLVSRIVISGRPPVTNLTSASIFIAWAALLLALGLEYFFRNSIGLLVAAAVGFASLLMADGLAVQEGDTLKVLQAVLDTNFWLATHVVCVTLGYATTILAGVLGAVYILGGVFTPSIDKETGKELTRMTYGVVCFAMLFSFIGTVLGGIWADQSWGRFWGWDSKENGAVLVVLTNAILLHARWGGLVKERGIAVLSIFGIMVTQWSFFGTNQLGIGLHAYGFTEGLWGKLILAWGVELAILLVGLIPLHAWASNRLPAEDPREATGHRPRAMAAT